MTKNNISELSTSSGSNTTIDDIDVSGTTGKVKDGDNVMRSTGAILAKFYDDFGGVCTVGGTANAITITSSTTFVALATGMRLMFTPGADNTGATTLNLDAIGAKAVRKIVGATDVAIAAGDLLSGKRHEIVYSTAANSAAGGWILINPATVSVPSLILPGTAAGPAQITLGEDTDNGSNTVTLVAPSSMSADITNTLPNGTGTLGIVSQWVAYTPTFVGCGTVASVSVWSRRVGDSLEGRGTFTTGTTTANFASMTIGFNGSSGGITIDTAKIPATGSPVMVGKAGIKAISGAYDFQVFIDAGTSGSVFFGFFNSTNAGLTPVNGSTIFGNSTVYSFSFSGVPISGWV